MNSSILAFLLHTDAGGTGLIKGLLHPVTGLDHLLAMVSVGIVSSQRGGAHVWRMPSLFVFSMFAGGLAGIFGLPLPLAEVGIALSVAVLGFSIVWAKPRQSTWPIYCFVAVFGVFHGHAHGAEIPRSIDPALYVIGFLFSTSALHIVGVLIGEIARLASWSERLLRLAGAIVAATGLWLLALLR